MLLRRISKHVKDQNWFAVALDFVIVVVGILIAFQITNWNEARGDNARIERRLDNLIVDLRADIDEMSQITEIAQWRSSAIYAILTASDNAPVKQYEAADGEIFDIFEPVPFESQLTTTANNAITWLATLDGSRGAYEALISTGDLHIIKDENLAREMLELHTLGVDGAYTQGDVRQLAELLTGVTFDLKEGFRFRPAFSEPGAETVLGREYGGGRAQINDVFRAIDDLARHPETGRHIARKLAMHFISDQPDASIINVMADRFNETGGDLMQIYRAMLEHPAAWEPTARNVKQPIDYMGSALRALDIEPRHMPLRKPAKMVNGFLTPLALMGQKWGRPLGPDGWPEADEAWITPQRLAARLQWGMMAPTLLRRKLPDPREFVQMVLDDEVPGPLQFATAAAESRAEGIAIVLASPAFQRM